MRSPATPSVQPDRAPNTADTQNCDPLQALPRISACGCGFPHDRYCRPAALRLAIALATNKVDAAPETAREPSLRTRRDRVPVRN